MSEPTLNMGLTQREIQQLEAWHLECEKRCAEMREYELAERHKERNRLFKGIQNSGPYRAMMKLHKI